MVIVTYKLTQRFDEKLQNEYQIGDNQLEEITEDQFRLGTWVDYCDQLLKRICAAMLITNTPLTTILIYLAIIESDVPLTTRIQVIGWIAGQILQILAFSSAAIINRKSGKFRDVLYSRYCRNAKINTIHELFADCEFCKSPNVIRILMLKVVDMHAKTLARGLRWVRKSM